MEGFIFFIIIFGVGLFAAILSKSSGLMDHDDNYSKNHRMYSYDDPKVGISLDLDLRNDQYRKTVGVNPDITQSK